MLSACQHTVRREDGASSFKETRGGYVYDVGLFLCERMGKIGLCAVGGDSWEISAGVKRSHLAVLWPPDPKSAQNQPLNCGSR